MQAELTEEVKNDVLEGYTEAFGKNIAEKVLAGDIDPDDRDYMTDVIAEVMEDKEFDLDKALDTYDPTFPNYTPSVEAFEFFNLMRLVQGEDFEFETPIAHYFMVDILLGSITDTSVFPYSHEVNKTIELDPLRVGFMESRGLAKALPLDYPIMSEYPGKTIGNCKVGDKIYDGNGKICKITAKSPVFNKQMYRITLLDGRTIDMSEDHINIVWKRGSKQLGTDKSIRAVDNKGGKRFKPIKVTGLKEVDMTAKELYEAGVTRSREVTDKCPKGIEYKYWIPNVGLDAEYPETHFEIDPYTVGVILGDSSVEQKNGFTRITCHKDDYEEYKKNIPYELGTYTIKKDKDGTESNCGMFSLLGLSGVIKKFVGIARSYDKRVPEPLLHGSRKQRLEVLRGLMDTDGSAYAGSGTCAFDSTSVQLAKDVQWLVRSLGGSASIKKNKTSSPFRISYRVKISINEDIFKLSRKSRRVQYRNDKYCVAITKIEKIDSVPTQCITVDSDHKSFITKDWTVTHNSTIGISFFAVYSAIKGTLPNGIGKVYFYLLLAASTKGGARVNALAVRAMCEDSKFLNDYFEEMRFTETESEFVRKGDGPKKNRSFLIRYQGINTGVRGSRYGERRPDCHVRGTIVTTEYGTYPVEDHPGLKSEGHWEYCTEVRLAGLPNTEIVSNNHKYWAKPCARGKCVQDLETGAKLPRYSEAAPRWVDASKLNSDYWVGSPISTVTVPVQPIAHRIPVACAGRDASGRITGGAVYTDVDRVHKHMLDTEWWWAYGLWLGDGTLGTASTATGASNRASVIWTVAYTEEDTVGVRLKSILDKLGKKYTVQDSNGCYRLKINDTVLANWMRAQKTGNSMKVMPDWVLQLDTEKQKQILLGYIAADGFIDMSRNRQIRVNSVNYRILQQLQVICSRLGLPSHIRNTKRAGTQTWFNGVTCEHKHQWEIRLKDNVSDILGITGITNGSNHFPQVHIADGMLWRQVKSIEITEDKYELIPIQCNSTELCKVIGEKHAYTTEFGISKNCIIFDDAILNTAAAYSKVMSENLDEILHSDSTNALKGGGKGRVLLYFTPFHYGDVNTKALISGAFTPVVIPLARSFDADDVVKPSMIQSSWEAMHPRKSIAQLIKTAKKAKKMKLFMQERMLRLTSGADRLIPDNCIQFCDMKLITDNIGAYSIYITTDYTTTSGENSDYSGIATWAVSSNNDWFLLNLTLRKRTMETQYMETLNEAAAYKRMGKAVEIGVEVDGNQNAHIHGLERLMMTRGDWYTFARDKNDPEASRKGILSRASGVKKHERFRIASQILLQQKMWFPEHLKETPDMKEFINQIKGATHESFTRADDGPDLITMSQNIITVLPSIEVANLGVTTNNNGYQGSFGWKRLSNQEELVPAWSSYT